MRRPSRSLRKDRTRSAAGRAALAVLALAGPAGSRAASAASPTLDDTSWQVTGYGNGRKAVVNALAGTTLTLEFSAADNSPARRAATASAAASPARTRA